MAATKYLAIDSLGAEHTRSSQRVYTHTVVVMYDYDVAINRVTTHHATKEAIASQQRNFDYEVSIATGNDPHPEYDYVQVDGKWQRVYNDATAARQAIRAAKSSAEIEGGFEAYRARILAKELERVEERKEHGAFTTWGSVGFCGRLDLAQKLAAQCVSDGTKIEILPVVVAPPKVKKARAKAST